MDDNKKYYLFSYGSNSIKQIKNRVEIDDSINIPCIPAYLPNHKIVFRGFSKRWNGGIAAFIPSKNNNLLGICTQLTLSEIEKMDGFEGGYERIIRKVMIYVQDEELFTNSWKEVESFIYDKINKDKKSKPSIEYKNAIETMYLEREYSLNHQ